MGNDLLFSIAWSCPTCNQWMFFFKILYQWLQDWDIFKLMRHGLGQKSEELTRSLFCRSVLEGFRVFQLKFVMFQAQHKHFWINENQCLTGSKIDLFMVFGNHIYYCYTMVVSLFLVLVTKFNIPTNFILCVYCRSSCRLYYGLPYHDGKAVWAVCLVSYKKQSHLSFGQVFITFDFL